jgi:hypothetical protein
MKHFSLLISGRLRKDSATRSVPGNKLPVYYRMSLRDKESPIGMTHNSMRYISNIYKFDFYMKIYYVETRLCFGQYLNLEEQ